MKQYAVVVEDDDGDDEGRYVVAAYGPVGRMDAGLILDEVREDNRAAFPSRSATIVELLRWQR